jgi:putative hydrolase of the HAD superfamily
MRPIEKKQIKACAFDLGNTLINDTRLSKDAADDMGGWLFSHSFISSKETFLATFEKVNHGTVKPFISHTFGELDFFEQTFKALAVNTISAQAALEKYREILIKKIHPDPDIVATFQLLKQKNIRIALVSNERVSRVDAYMQKTNLRHFFDAIIVSEGIGIEKPDLRIFQEASKRLNLKGEEMVMFGDNQIADGASKNLGIFFVLVTGYMNKAWIWEEGNPYPPDYIMEKVTPKDMTAFLNKVALNQ